MILSQADIRKIKAENNAKKAVYGDQTIVRNIKAKSMAISLAVSRGLRKAGLELQAQSMRLTPVDYGILKASAFTRHTGKGHDTVVNVGYTAAYAIYVHENVDMVGKGLPRGAGHKGFYWDPQATAQSKFLEEPFRNFAHTLHKIVKAEVMAA